MQAPVPLNLTAHVAQYIKGKRKRKTEEREIYNTGGQVTSETN